jgi:RNA polymerase sigma-70 factor, ECF subfamily
VSHFRPGGTLLIVGDPVTSAAHLRLVDAAEAGAGSLERLYRQYCRYVATIALRVLGRPDEVDDVIQDVFLAAERGRGAIANPDAVKSWLATVTVRTARARLRRRRLRALLGLDEAPSYLDVADPGLSPADRLQVSRIYAALDRLPVPLRLAWALRHIEGESLDEVAAHCGCSLASAKRHIAAAQARLREVLDG